MNPLSGFAMEVDVEGGRPLTMLLFGVWPVAIITKSVESSVPLVSWTVNGVLFFGNPFGGIAMREPVTSLKVFVSISSFPYPYQQWQTYSTPSSSNRPLTISCNLSWN